MCDQHQITPARRDPSSLRSAGPREADSRGGGAGGPRSRRRTPSALRLSAHLAALPGGLHSDVHNSLSSPNRRAQTRWLRVPGTGYRIPRILLLLLPGSHLRNTSLLRSYPACPLPLLRESLAGGKLIFNIVKLIKGLEAYDGVGGRVGP